MSGGMIKIGIFGILKVGLDLLSASGVQVWWGLMVMVFGAISSVLGVAFALQEHDIKRCWPITPSRTSASFCSASAPPWPPWRSIRSASPSWL